MPVLQILRAQRGRQPYWDSRTAAPQHGLWCPEFHVLRFDALEHLGVVVLELGLAYPPLQPARVVQRGLFEVSGLLFLHVLLTLPLLPDGYFELVVNLCPVCPFRCVQKGALLTFYRVVEGVDRLLSIVTIVE